MTNQSLRQITVHVILFARLHNWYVQSCNRTPARETLADSGCFLQYLPTYPLLIHCSIWQCSRELFLCCRIEVKQACCRVNHATRFAVAMAEVKCYDSRIPNAFVYAAVVSSYASKCRLGLGLGHCYWLLNTLYVIRE